MISYLGEGQIRGRDLEFRQKSVRQREGVGYARRWTAQKCKEPGSEGAYHLHDHLPRTMMRPVGVRVREDVDGRRAAKRDQAGVAAPGSGQTRLRLKP